MPIEFKPEQWNTACTSPLPWTAARKLTRQGDHRMLGYFSRRRSSSLEIAPWSGFQIPASAKPSHLRNQVHRLMRVGFLNFPVQLKLPDIHPFSVWILSSSLESRRAEMYLLANGWPSFLISLQQCCVISEPLPLFWPLLLSQQMCLGLTTKI